MGLESTTFCMASARRRSHPFAPVRLKSYLQGFLRTRPNTSEPERTTSVTIVTTALRLEGGRELLPQLHGTKRGTFEPSTPT